VGSADIQLTVGNLLAIAFSFSLSLVAEPQQTLVLETERYRAQFFILQKICGKK
jgi:hypothetical protein